MYGYNHIESSWTVELVRLCTCITIFTFCINDVIEVNCYNIHNHHSILYMHVCMCIMGLSNILLKICVLSLRYGPKSKVHENSHK